MQLKLENSVDSIVASLEKMRQTLLDEDSNDLADNQAFQDECTSDLASLQADIDSANNLFDSDQRDISINTVSLESLQDQLDQAQLSKSAKESQLNDLEAQREQEKEAYESSVNDISTALTTLYNGKKVLKQLLSEPDNAVFLQNKKNPKKTLLVEFSNTMKENLVAGSGVRGLMNYFSQILQNNDIQADQDLVQKVLDLIDLLISKLNDDQTSEEDAENSRIEVYQRQRTNLQGEINDLSSQIADFSSQIKTLTDSIENLKQDTVSQEAIAQEKQDQLDIKRKSCKAEQDSFDERSKNRYDFF